VALQRNNEISEEHEESIVRFVAISHFIYLNPEDEGSTFLRNIGIVSQSRHPDFPVNQYIEMGTKTVPVTTLIFTLTTCNLY
jgi:hypothetical protein